MNDRSAGREYPPVTNLCGAGLSGNRLKYAIHDLADVGSKFRAYWLSSSEFPAFRIVCAALKIRAAD